FCLIQAEQSLHQISGTTSGTWRTASDRALGRLRSELDYLTIEEVTERGLHEFLDDLQVRLNEVGDQIFADFFALESV
ncbi:MAG: alpha-E domain-containing protein, partial [Cyanobacteria bacterium REEB459]|nr:alpha-E domain-containing protein [Cyanobacteria bacterium REEB459]